MFAIDGPIDNISVSVGVSDLIHVPASRPPGTPPVPARHEVDPAALMLDQLNSASDAATAAVATTPTARGMLAWCRQQPRPTTELAGHHAHTTAHEAAT